jgi:hypothetical protein
LPDGLFRIEYQLSGFEFLAQQELQIEFSAAVFVRLTNAVVPAGFDALLFQPGNPAGTSGRLSALALVDHPNLSDGFFVDVEMFRDPRSQGAEHDGRSHQWFAINQLDEQDKIVSRLASGNVATAVPEPATAQMTTVVLFGIAAGLVCLRRGERRSRRQS